MDGLEMWARSCGKAFDELRTVAIGPEVQVIVLEAESSSLVSQPVANVLELVDSTSGSSVMVAPDVLLMRRPVESLSTT
jgi:hypothetical protein